ncbi:MAG TPA: glycosyltransferase family 2 protein [Flavobacteriales bacterium]|nr:glycosyltransferase family 2 protein [Flavobacteriales bacterium]
MHKPRISVLMTLFNKAPFVEEAVRSVLASNFSDFELLVVDDGSTDDGPSRVSAINDPRVQLLRSAENKGRAHAANRGFDAAQGEYIAILDADDTMHEERLRKQVEFLDAHPGIAACGSAAQAIGERQHIAHWPTTDHEARGLLLFEDPMLYGASMFRRSILAQHGLRCPESWNGPGMDYLFLLKLASVAAVANMPEPLTSYRIGTNNFRHGRSRLEDTKAIVEAALKHFGIAHSPEDLRSHLVLLRRDASPANEAEVQAVNGWCARLRRFNAEARVFPADVFERRLRQEEDHLFFVLADRNIRLARLHARLSGGWSCRRLRYLLSSPFNRKGHSSTLPSQ